MDGAVAEASALAVEIAVEIEGPERELSPFAETPPSGQGHTLAAEDAEEIRLGEAAGDVVAGTEVVFGDGEVGAGIGPLDDFAQCREHA